MSRVARIARSKPRVLTAAVLAVLAAAGLAACDSQAGVAATVAGQRITERQVDAYLTGAAPAADAVAQVGAGRRALVVGQVIQNKLVEQVLTATAQGMPTDAELAASHDAALAAASQSLSGAAFDKALLAQVRQLGLNTRFRDLTLRSYELLYALINRTNITTQDQLAALFKPFAVTVSARYGVWDSTGVQLNSAAGAGAPSFVRMDSLVAAAANS